MLRRLLFFGVVLSLSACGESTPRDDLGDVQEEPPPEDPRPARGGNGGSRMDPGTGGAGGSNPTSPADAGASPMGTVDAAAPGADGAPASSDASPRDAVVTNPTAPGLGGTPSCAAPRGILCEDFEKGAVGAGPPGWNREGSPQVAGDETARGQRTLRARTPQRVTYSNNRITRGLSIPGTHWGRIYYRVALPAPRPPSGVIHATFVAFGGTMPSGGTAEFRVVDTVLNSFNNKHSYLYNVQPTSSREFGRGTGANWTFDGEWKCVEWFIDEANQAYQLFLNGGQTPVLAFSNGAGNYDRSQIPKTFNSVRVGVTHYQNSQTGYVVSLDELVIDTKRVGCE